MSLTSNYPLYMKSQLQLQIKGKYSAQVMCENLVCIHTGLKMDQKKAYFWKGVPVDLRDLHLRQDLLIDGHGCFKYLIHALPLMLQPSSCLVRQSIDWYFWSWQPPLLFLSSKRELWTTQVIFLSYYNAPIHIPELRHAVVIQ